MKYLRRTWAEIDLDAAAFNLWAIRERLPGKRIIAVVKADGYGHGASALASLYQKLGVDFFAVSNMDEARALRRDGITGDIIILGYTPPDMADELIENGIVQTVTDVAFARELGECARKAGGSVRCHAKLDTGMSRLGWVLRRQEDIPTVVSELKTVNSLPGIGLEGAFMHFSSADGDITPTSGDGSFTREQARLFDEAVCVARREGVALPFLHVSNSAAVVNYPELAHDGIRPGIILYGLTPDSAVNSPMNGRLPLRPVMTLKTTVSQVKTLPRDSAVSYGRTFTAPGEMKTAVVSIGYADGLLRRFSPGVSMVIHGKPAPVVGRICMDMCMLDITGREDVFPGDEVTVFGPGATSWEEAANLAGTIHYELTCLVGKRIPRIYLTGGREVARENLFLTGPCCTLHEDFPERKG